MSFRPEQVPYSDDIGYLREYLGRQFNLLVASFETVDLVQLEELHIEPTRPVTGMVRFADGTDWDPGNGRGLYFFDGTDWQELVSTTGGDLNAIEALATNGLLARTGTDTWATRTITGTANEIEVTNGDGVSGNPTIGIPNSPSFVTPTMSGPTVTGLLTLSGGQIAFPATQSASANPNTLDDYEEGTWTPGLTFGGAAVGLTYSLQSGQYTKIGGLINISGRITLSAKGSSTGGAAITGSPAFPSANDHGAGYVGNFAGMAALTASLDLLVGTTQIALRDCSATASTGLDDTNFTNTSDIIFGATFRVA